MIADEILYIGQKTKTKYYYFFYSEIKQFLGKEEFDEIQQEFHKYDPNIFLYFKEKRKIGENELNICELILNDSIQQFVAHMNRTSCNINFQYNPSFFESNPFLILIFKLIHLFLRRINF